MYIRFLGAYASAPSWARALVEFLTHWLENKICNNELLGNIIPQAKFKHAFECFVLGIVQQFNPMRYQQQVA